MKRNKREITINVELKSLAPIKINFPDNRETSHDDRETITCLSVIRVIYFR